MKPFRSWVHVFSMFFLSGSTLLLLFIVMSGSIDHAPINKFYWLQADTTGIPGAPEISRWTFWGICSPRNSGNNGNCTQLAPAFPFSPVDNFDTTENIPDSFVENRDTYYYLTRFTFPLYIIGLGFCVIALIISIVAFCSTTVSIISTIFGFISFIMVLAATCLATAAYVMGRDKFNVQGDRASLGRDMFAMSWTAVATLLLSFIIDCGFCTRNVYRRHKMHMEAQERYEQSEVAEKNGQPFDQFDLNSGGLLHTNDYATAGQNRQSYLSAIPQDEDINISTDVAAPQEDSETGTGIRFHKVRKDRSD